MGFNLSRCIKKEYDKFLSKSKSDHQIYGYLFLGVISGLASLVAYCFGSEEFLFGILALNMAYFSKTIGLIVRHGIIDFKKPEFLSCVKVIGLVIFASFVVVLSFIEANKALDAFDLSVINSSIIGFILLVTFPAIEGFVERFHKRKVLCR